MNYFNKSLLFIKEVVIQDIANRYLLSATLVFALLDYALWKIYLSSADTFVAVKFGVYPVKFLALVLVINSFLAFFSFNKEKEITYLFMMTNLVLSLLVLALEAYYFFATI